MRSLTTLTIFFFFFNDLAFAQDRPMEYESLDSLVIQMGILINNNSPLEDGGKVLNSFAVRDIFWASRDTTGYSEIEGVSKDLMLKMDSLAFQGASNALSFMMSVSQSMQYGIELAIDNLTYEKELINNDLFSKYLISVPIKHDEISWFHFEVAEVNSKWSIQGVIRGFVKERIPIDSIRRQHIPYTKN